ncbi:MAG: histidinol dehydrogenase, partial [Sedimentisphaerales bacterium]|nr:histidinol dehydrogenase [Sedimentisphaerales bacterium]
MPNKLDKILISASDPEWHEKIRVIHDNVKRATCFEDRSDEDNQLNKILQGVKNNKDTALREYTDAFDKVKLTPEQFRVSKEDLEKAHKQIDPKLLKSIRQSIQNVRKYQQEIFVGDKNTHPGIKYTPIKRVGICVPGAAAPLPSTVIMTAVPAQVAGVKEIVVVSPPRYNKDIHPVTLATCYELRIKEVYRIGGAQAVAALAYGTQTITPVSKIVGPGNQWVQMAKRKVFGIVDIDSIAGPSEVLIIANEKANPAWVAADMLSQAEHAPGSAVVFTNSQNFAQRTLETLKEQVNKLSRKEATIKCLSDFGAIIVFKDMSEVTTQADFFASEHLEIQCGDESRKIAEKIQNAGAIFIGDYTPVAVGDYWAGPSHTLPTGQT